MASPFVAEIRAFGFNFAPVGWALCNGQLLLISQNTALFSLVGTQYGGDGRSTFGLPNLQGRVPMHTDEFSGQDQYPIGASGGVESVTLTLQELPAHSHAFIGTTSAANVKRPVSGSAYAQSALAGTSPAANYYGPDTSVIPINANTVGINVGSGQPHENRQPFLTINWCIAMQGVYPSRN